MYLALHAQSKLKTAATSKSWFHVSCKKARRHLSQSRIPVPSLGVVQKRQLQKSTSFVASLRDQIEAMNCSLVCSLPVLRHSATSNRHVTGSIHGHARTQPAGTVGGPAVSFYRPVLSSVTLSPAQKGVEKVQSNRACTASAIKSIGQEATKLEAAIQLEKQAAAPAIQLVADIAEIETKLQKRIRELQAQDASSTFCSCCNFLVVVHLDFSGCTCRSQRYQRD